MDKGILLGKRNRESSLKLNNQPVTVTFPVLDSLAIWDMYDYSFTESEKSKTISDDNDTDEKLKFKNSKS
jgi:hypothetical protein